MLFDSDDTTQIRGTSEEGTVADAEVTNLIAEPSTNPVHQELSNAGFKQQLFESRPTPSESTKKACSSCV